MKASHILFCLNCLKSASFFGQFLKSKQFAHNTEAKRRSGDSRDMHWDESFALDNLQPVHYFSNDLFLFLYSFKSWGNMCVKPSISHLWGFESPVSLASFVVVPKVWWPRDIHEMRVGRDGDSHRLLQFPDGSQIWEIAFVLERCTFFFHTLHKFWGSFLCVYFGPLICDY